MNETLGEIVALTPRPKGEGAWAWLRFKAIRLRSWLNNTDTYCQASPGCPYPPWPIPNSSQFCQRHYQERHLGTSCGQEKSTGL
jgi:hypothetical protein